ncbi:MAG TPA: integrin [Gammaproteobacteria bacterium]|nr:integrin [Gammaproteobacteria bacterium]
MKPAARTVKRFLVFAGILALGILIAVLIPPGIDTPRTMDSTPAGTGAPDTATVNPDAAGPDERAPEDAATDGLATTGPNPDLKRESPPESEPVNPRIKPGAQATQPHSNTGAKPAAESTPAKPETETPAVAVSGGQSTPHMPDGAPAQAAGAGTQSAAGGKTADKRPGALQEARSANGDFDNPNSALVGITPVPGYVNVNKDSNANPSTARQIAGEAGALNVVPGSSGNSGLPVPVLKLEIAGIKTFRFSWADIAGETEYRLLEKIGGTGFQQIATLPADRSGYDLSVFLPRRANARYILQACNGAGCASSMVVRMSGSLAEAVGYIKASNTGREDRFGHSVALSGDGNTLVVGAPAEDGAGSGVNDEQSSDSASTSGAVYVYTRSGGDWVQQAYLKAARAQAGEEFGYALALSDNGNTLAVGAGRESSSHDRVKGDADLRRPSGGVYIFIRNRGKWSQQVYVKASNLADKDAADTFGESVALSGDGSMLAVGADGENSGATGINGDQNNSRAQSSGAVYIFSRRGNDWSQQAYVKASNTEAGDHFGRSVSLSAAGTTLAVGAVGEDSAAAGINGDQNNNKAISSGAVYVYTRSGADWKQQAYLKASNNRPGELLTGDEFGVSVALSGNGNTLAVGARFEDSLVTGVNPGQNAASNHSSGAVYVYTRSGGNWKQQAFVKASNTGWGDEFGGAVALSGNGATLAVGANGEGSNAVGINGDQDNNMYKSPGAAYVYTRSGGQWVQRGYVKASNTGQSVQSPEEAFGFSLALSDSGETLAVGAPFEDSAATGIGGDQDDNSAAGSGAVYLY